MTPSEAETLVRQIAACWSDGTWNSAAIDLWKQDLADLNAGAAGTAFARLRRTWKATRYQTHPSVGQFFDEYRTVDTYRPPDTIECDACDGTGWAPGAPIVGKHQNINGDLVVYGTVQPCACENGNARRPVFAAINETNSRRS